MTAPAPPDRSGLRRRTLLRAGAAAAGGVSLAALTAAPGHAAYPRYALGSSSPVVRAVQEWLGRTGFWCGTPDGYFGPLTQQAVWAQQKAAGLKTDGIVGPRTLSAIGHGHVPLPAGGPTGIEIDLARQLLLVVRDGAVTMVLNTSTGNGEPYDWYGRELSAVTRPGHFEVFRTHTTGWQSGPLGELYRPQYFNGGVAVHGSESIPPWPDSHGCCRVSVAAMDLLWEQELMAMGTPVLVY